MAKARFPIWTAALLAVAGLGIVPFGLRAVRLERDETELRIGEALLWGARRAIESAESPDGPPDETWEIVPAGHPSPEALGDDLVLLQQADFLERGPDPAAGESIHSRLASRENESPGTYVAALRAGAAAVRAGDVAVAERHLRRAARAPEELVEENGLPVVLLAGYHRARLSLASGDREGVDAFLERAGGGYRVGDGKALGPDDLVLALAEGAGEDAPPALRLAAERARRGREARSLATPQVWDGRIFHRYGSRLEARLLASLVPIADVPPGIEIHVWESGNIFLAEGVREMELEPALHGVTLLARSTRTDSVALPLFAAAFLVYLLGAVLAVVAIRRSERAARMQADFVAAVSHEMKTPIASVRAMAEMLSDGVAEEPARARLYAERIEREMRRLGASVRNVLDAARIERMEEIPLAKRPAEPLRVVEDAVAAVLPTLEGRGFRLEVEGAPLGRDMDLDADAFHGVLSNLLDNAAKYSGEARDIRVEAGPSSGEYRVAVLDRGIGVPADERSRLFARFFRGAAAKRAAIPGVGLGLHVAREVVRAHGGDLTVEARDGGGSAFVVRLPAGGTT